MPLSTRGFTFKPATLDDVPNLTNDMLDMGLRDYDRLGQHPVLAVACYILEEDAYLVHGPDGSLYGAYAVTEDNFLWLQMTNQLKKNPITAARFSRALIDHIDRPFLWATIDIQNTALIKIARYCGFKVLRVLPEGPYNYYSLEIVRLC